MIKRLLFLSAFFLSLIAVAQDTVHVTWRFSDFRLSPMSVKRVTIQPLYAPGIHGTNIIVSDAMSFQTGTNGSLTVSNIANGRSYRVTFFGLPTQFGTNILTVFTNTFPTNVTGLVSGADPQFISAPIQDAATVAYSRAATDSLFLRRTNGIGANVTLYGTNTFSAISLGGVARTNWPDGGGGTVSNALPPLRIIGGAVELTNATLLGLSTNWLAGRTFLSPTAFLDTVGDGLIVGGDVPGTRNLTVGIGLDNYGVDTTMVGIRSVGFMSNSVVVGNQNFGGIPIELPTPHEACIVIGILNDFHPTTPTTNNIVIGAYNDILGSGTIVIGTGLTVTNDKVIDIGSTNGPRLTLRSDGSFLSTGLSVNGDVIASGGFYGSAVGLTNLQAGALSSGTIPSARLTGVTITNAVLRGDGDVALIVTNSSADPVLLKNSHLSVDGDVVGDRLLGMNTVSAGGGFFGSAVGLSNATPALATNNVAASNDWLLAKSGDCLKFVDRTAQAVTDALNPSVIIVKDEFCGGFETSSGAIGELGWRMMSGSSGTVDTGWGTNRPCVRDIRTGSSVSNFCALTWGALGWGQGEMVMPPCSNALFQFEFRLPSQLTNAQVLVGVSSSVLYAPTWLNPPTGIWLFATNNSNFFFGARASGSWTALTNSGVAVDANWHKLTIAFTNAVVDRRAWFRLDNGNEVVVSNTFDGFFTYGPVIAITTGEAAVKSLYIDRFVLVTSAR